MFIIKSEKNDTINWPVTVEVAQDGGKLKKYEFTGTFLLLDDDEKEAAAAEIKAANPVTDVAEQGANDWKDASIDAIMRVMTGWKGVADAAGTPVEFTRDNLRAAVRSRQGTGILRGINIAMAEISTGSKQKN